MYRRGRSQYRRSRGNQRAANQQRDTTQVVINENLEISCGENMYNYNEDEMNFEDTGTIALNMYDVLRRNSFFKNYASLYDSVRIDNIRVKIIGVNWVNGSGRQMDSGNKLETYKSPKSYVVVTAWDRTGLSEEQVVRYDKIQEVITNVNNQPVTTQYKKPTLFTNIGRNINSYSSALTKHLGPGSSYEIVRQCYPSNALEKGQFVSVTNMIYQQSLPDTNGGFGMKMYNLGRDNQDHTIPVDNYNIPYVYDQAHPNDWQQHFTWDKSMPTNLMESPAIAFKPTLLINVIAGNAPGIVHLDAQGDIINLDKMYTDPGALGNIAAIEPINQIKPVTFSLEFHIAVTFRGMRYSRIVLTHQNEEENNEPAPEPEPQPNDDNMDEDDNNQNTDSNN